MPVRLQDIAAELGVSVSAVSLAFRDPSRIAEETRQKVYDVADRLGYIHRSRRAGRAEIKTLTFMMQHAPHGDFYAAVLSGAENECQQHNIALHFALLEELTPRSIKRYGQSDALMVVGSVEAELVAQLKAELKLPMVLVDNNLPGSGLDRVLTENIHSAYASVMYLARLGHTQIACMRGIAWHPSFRERLQGYRAAVDELGLAPIELACDRIPLSIGAQQATHEWLAARGNQPGFTAIVVCNDDAAAGVLHGLHAHGLRVPQDVSVVGFDDHDIAALVQPKLTTCHVYRERLGALGVQSLIERVREPDEPTRAIMLDTRFVERDSVRPLTL